MDRHIAGFKGRNAHPLLGSEMPGSIPGLCASTAKLNQNYEFRKEKNYMFSRYSELIKNLFRHIVKPESVEVSFMDYLTVLGQTALILLVLAGMIAVFSIIILIPIWLYKIYISGVKKKMNDLLALVQTNQTNIYDLEKCKKNIRNRNILYVIIIAVIYIPFMIPTVLFILTLISNAVR